MPRRAKREKVGSADISRSSLVTDVVVQQQMTAYMNTFITPVGTAINKQTDRQRQTDREHYKLT